MTVDEYNYDLSLKDDHLRELGRIIAESSGLEGVVEIAIWQTLQIPSTLGEQITTSPNLGQLVRVLLAIVPRAFNTKTDKDEFAPIAQELQAVVSLRNHVAHCFWTFGTEENKPLSLNHRNEKGEIAARSKHWEPEELYRIAARLSRVGNELEWYIKARGGGSPPPHSRDWKPFQVPPEPKWKSVSVPRQRGQLPTSPPSSQSS